MMKAVLGSAAAPALAIPPGPWPLERGYEFCEQVARSRYENFPVASRFIPQALRKHMWAVYAFARLCDDIADEPLPGQNREEALDAWEHALVRCFHGEAEHPVFVALGDTAARRELPIAPFEQLLASFRMDLSVRRYPTYRDLCAFTHLGAEPVGRTVLYLFGYRDPALHRYADAMCTALQQVNFWQDVTRDLSRDRVYIPSEDLHHFGVTEAQLGAAPAGPALRSLLRFEVARTRSLFERGRPLCELVGRDLAFELKLIWLAGMAVLDKIEAQDYDVLAARPVLSIADKAHLVAGATAWTAKTRLSGEATREAARRAR
jgi:squalene synthase HpnC